MAPSADRLNWLNAGLMLGACLAAFLYPFELFLFSYAVLGPLHYVTEISWLHERKYFISEQARSRSRLPGWLLIVALAMVVLTAAFVSATVVGVAINPVWEVTAVYLVLVTALLVTLVTQRSARALALISAAVLLALLSFSRYYVVLAFLLVTIVHVLVFTAAFVLHGALKGRSGSGMISLGVFAGCVASFFLFVPAGHDAGNYVRQSYSSFVALNIALIKLFRLGAGAPADVFDSHGGLVVMRLIAFAYTYHYLNWFSKTSVIRWHQVPARRAALMGVIWLAALALYARDYVTGIAALHFLSMLHVMLEFPLNHLTFAGIARELSALAARRQSSRRPAAPAAGADRGWPARARAR